KNLAKHGCSKVAVVNGVFGRVVAHELFVGRGPPLRVAVIRRQNDNASTASLGELRGDLRRDRDNALLPQFSRELDGLHDETLVASKPPVNVRGGSTAAPRHSPHSRPPLPRG